MKYLLGVLALPVALGAVAAFLKIRFALIKDEAKKLETMRRWFGE